MTVTILNRAFPQKGGIGMMEENLSCRPQDFGKFEIVERDGAARIGKIHTNHGILTTPTLLPVVNPNILTVEPRETWDKFGFERVPIRMSYGSIRNSANRHWKTESMNSGFSPE